jgi:hypothetical protein
MTASDDMFAALEPHRAAEEQPENAGDVPDGPISDSLAGDAEEADVEAEEADEAESAQTDPSEAQIDVPEPPQTGDPAVDDAITAVAQAVGGSLEEQLAAYEAAHGTLQDRLADVEG